MDLGLGDKVALVTGASGGIGQALVAAFLAEGARVVAYARRAARGHQGIAIGDRLMWIRGDVRRQEDLEAAAREAEARWGRVDVCVANAGVWPPEDLAIDALPEDRFREVIETNLIGAAWTARALIASLRRTGARGDGHGASLVFIGSTAGRFGERGHAEYAASKAGLRGLMLSLKNEIVRIDPAGRVNLVEPGWVATEMAQATLEREGHVEAATRTMAIRRIATPEDVAAAVLFFASPVMSRHVSGEALLVAGGMEGRVLW